MTIRGKFLLTQLVFLVTGLSVFTASWQGGIPMALWHYIFLAFSLVLLILTAGCTDSTPPTPVPTLSTLPVPHGTVLPGQVLQVFGDVSGSGIPGGTIDTITFTVGLNKSQNSVDMEHITIVYADAISSETLLPVAGFRGDPPKGFWGIIRVEKEVGTPNNRLDYEEQFVIRINPSAFLVPNQFITINVKPADSSSLTLRRVSPPSILAENILSPL